jgi:hypothetical protein
MWIKKSQLELDQESDKCQSKSFTDIKQPFLLALIFTVFAVTAWCGGYCIINWQNSHSLLEAWEKRHYFFALFIIGYAGTYMLQVLFPRLAYQPKSRYYLCLKCGEFYLKHIKMCPKCKRTLVDSRNYKWVEKPRRSQHHPAPYPEQRKSAVQER